MSPRYYDAVILGLDGVITHGERPRVFDDAVTQVKRWRSGGMKAAVVSSRRNCVEVLETAGLADLFDVRIDGVIAERLGLKGEPDPGALVEAARRLDVEPRRAAVLEGTTSGVQAGSSGGFGLVAGVDRTGVGDDLRNWGADLVVRDLDELDLDRRDPNAPREPTRLPSALDCGEAFRARLTSGRPAFFLDYDGTLTPIVRKPEDAELSDRMRSVLRKLASRFPVAVVSGRDRRDVESLVGIEGLIYAGSHGFDIAGPDGLRLEQAQGKDCLPDLDSAEQELRGRIESIPGAAIERKQFSIAVHYRNAPATEVGAIERIVDEALGRRRHLTRSGGKKVFELRPDVEWDKGRAVLWLLEALGLDGSDVVPLYLGDDLTDEDAFRALLFRGIGIGVGEMASPTYARYGLSDTDQVGLFLDTLSEV